MIKILAIDDSSNSLISLKAIISENLPDLLIYTAQEENQTAKLAIDHDPDVILLGLKKECIEICSLLKKDMRLTIIPIVFICSEQNDQDSRINAMNAGADAFLSKVADQTEFLTLIKAMKKVKNANALTQQRELNHFKNRADNSRVGKNNTIIALDLYNFDGDNYLSLKSDEVPLQSENSYRNIFHAEEGLKNALQQLEFHENNSPLAVIEFNDKFQITKWSKNARRIFGWSAEEVLGKSIGEFRWVHEDDQERVAILSAKMLGSKETSNCHTNRNYTKQGSVITCEWYNSAMIDPSGKLISVHSLVLDISNRKQAEELLKDSNDFNKTLLQAIPFGMHIVDENGEVLFVNEILEKNFGIEAKGKKCWTLFNDSRIKCLGCELLTGINIGKTTLSESYDGINNKIFQVSHTGMLFQGKKAMLEIFQDITDRKRIEAELINAKERAEESDQLKTSFLANMSHEIRTPLNSIIGFSEMLTDPDYDSTQQFHIARIIQSSGNNLLNIINNILDISKIEAGQVQINRKLFSVNKFLSDIERTYLFKSIEKGIEFIVEIPNPEMETFLLSDEGKIRQVIDNFISNSLKFTKRGSIHVGCKQQDDFIEFLVRDTGIGIPDEFHEKIFERFRQVEAVNTKTHGGNGLGLAISKGLIQLLGGNIWMESEKGKGSTFCFSIPLH